MAVYTLYLAFACLPRLRSKPRRDKSGVSPDQNTSSCRWLFLLAPWLYHHGELIRRWHFLHCLKPGFRTFRHFLVKTPEDEHRGEIFHQKTRPEPMAFRHGDKSIATLVASERLTGFSHSDIMDKPSKNTIYVRKHPSAEKSRQRTYPTWFGIVKGQIMAGCWAYLTGIAMGSPKQKKVSAIAIPFVLVFVLSV